MFGTGNDTATLLAVSALISEGMQVVVLIQFAQPGGIGVIIHSVILTLGAIMALPDHLTTAEPVVLVCGTVDSQPY